MVFDPAALVIVTAAASWLNVIGAPALPVPGGLPAAMFVFSWSTTHVPEKSG
jgi:hypothetical protein